MHGWRARIGMLLPSVNSAAEPQVKAMSPDGVSFHTTRLRLKGSSESDIMGMVENVEDAASLISQFDDNNCYLGIWETQTTNLVGLFGVLRDAEKEVEVGYWIDVNCQGRGFASEALSHAISRLERDLPDFDIVAHCAPDNQISRHVLVKHGFRQSQEAAKRPGRERFDLVQLD